MFSQNYLQIDVLTKLPENWWSHKITYKLVVSQNYLKIGGLTKLPFLGNKSQKCMISILKKGIECYWFEPTETAQCIH